MSNQLIAAIQAATTTSVAIQAIQQFLSRQGTSLAAIGEANRPMRTGNITFIVTASPEDIQQGAVSIVLQGDTVIVGPVINKGGPQFPHADPAVFDRVAALGRGNPSVLLAVAAPAPGFYKGRGMPSVRISYSPPDLYAKLRQWRLDEKAAAVRAILAEHNEWGGEIADNPYLLAAITGSYHPFLRVFAVGQGMPILSGKTVYSTDWREIASLLRLYEKDGVSILQMAASQYPQLRQYLPVPVDTAAASKLFDSLVRYASTVDYNTAVELYFRKEAAATSPDGRIMTLAHRRIVDAWRKVTAKAPERKGAVTSELREAALAGAKLLVDYIKGGGVLPGQLVGSSFPKNSQSLATLLWLALPPEARATSQKKFESLLPPTILQEHRGGTRNIEATIKASEAGAISLQEMARVIFKGISLMPTAFVLDHSASMRPAVTILQSIMDAVAMGSQGERANYYVVGAWQEEVWVQEYEATSSPIRVTAEGATPLYPAYAIAELLPVSLVIALTDGEHNQDTASVTNNTSLSLPSSVTRRDMTGLQKRYLVLLIHRKGAFTTENARVVEVNNSQEALAVIAQEYNRFLTLRCVATAALNQACWNVTISASL